VPADLWARLANYPLLFLGVLLLSVALYAAERLLALSGPMSALLRWWRGRELASLKREAELRAERRRIQMEEESAMMTLLRSQVAELSAEVERLRTVVRASEVSHRNLKAWADGILRATRAAGLAYTDPPRTGDLPTVPVELVG